MSQSMECCICYEEIGATNNNCTTPCGHKFCFTCVSKCLAKNNTCPCCREVLMEFDKNEGSELGDDVSDTETDYDFEEEPNLDIIADKFIAKGYTTLDLVSMLVGRVKERNEKCTTESIKQMFDDFNNIAEEVVVQREEQELFAAEDTRSKGAAAIGSA